MTIKTDSKTMVAARDLKVGDYFRHGGKFFRVFRNTTASATGAVDATVVVDDTSRSPAGEVSPEELSKWLTAQARGQR